MTKKNKHIFTQRRVKLLKLPLQTAVHGRTLRGFKQKQVPGRLCENGKRKSWCQFWQAMRTHCQVAARLGCAIVGQRDRLGQGPLAAAPSCCAWKQWAEPRWWWRPGPTTRDCCAWLQGQGGSKAKAGPRWVRWGWGQQNSRLTQLSWGPGLRQGLGPLLITLIAWGWGPWWDFPTIFLTVLQLSLLPGPGLQCHHLGAGLGLAGKWRTGYRASRCTQSCGTADESSAGQNSCCWGPGIHTINTTVASCCVQALACLYPISSWGITGGVPESLSCVVSSEISWSQRRLPRQWVGMTGRLGSGGNSWSILQCMLGCLQSHCLQLTKKLMWRTLEVKVLAIGTDQVPMVKVPAGACLAWSGTLLLGICN